MKIIATLSIIALAGLLTACGKQEKPSTPAQAPAPVAAPAPAPEPAQPDQADGKPADTAANGGPLLKKGSRW